jgi:hypothetical protein
MRSGDVERYCIELVRGLSNLALRAIRTWPREDREVGLQALRCPYKEVESIQRAAGGEKSVDVRGLGSGFAEICGRGNV